MIAVDLSRGDSSVLHGWKMSPGLLTTIQPDSVEQLKDTDTLGLSNVFIYCKFIFKDNEAAQVGKLLLQSKKERKKHFNLPVILFFRVCLGNGIQ